MGDFVTGSALDELQSSSATRLAAAIRDKDVSSEEIVRACLDRIDAVKPQLNAVVRLCRERALAEAQERDRAVASGTRVGPLHGVPMTIKDTFDTAGARTTYATLGRTDHIPATDATAVARVRAAGAVLIGKTNTPELTLSFDTKVFIEAVEVALLRHLLPRPLLGRHVAGRAAFDVLSLDAPRGRGQTEVRDLCLAMLVEHDVRRFEIPVQHAFVVRRREPRRKLLRNLDSFVGGSRPMRRKSDDRSSPAMYSMERNMRPSASPMS